MTTEEVDGLLWALQHVPAEPRGYALICVYCRRTEDRAARRCRTCSNPLAEVWG